MAKISAIDDDALLKIFETAVQASDGRPSEHQAPLNIARTCRHWRMIVLTTGSLWTRFVCDDFDDVNFVRLWLQRSRDAIIDLDTWACPNEILFRTIFENQSRFGKLLIRGGIHSQHPQHLQPVMIHDLSNATEMALGPGRVPFMVASNFLEVAEQLSLPSRPRPIAPKLTKLTVSLFSGGGICAVFDLLEQSPNLSELDLRFDKPVFDVHATRTFHPLSLDKLESLSLALPFQTLVVEWIRHLTAPSLRSLLITDHSLDGIGDDRLPETFAAFLERSQYGAPVERATLNIKNTGNGTWFRIVQALPGLKEFRSYAFPRSARDYEWLITRSRFGEVWPLLEGLQTYWNTGDILLEGVQTYWNTGDIDILAMVNFLLSRLLQPQHFSAVIDVSNTNEQDRRFLEDHEELSRWHANSPSGDSQYMAWSNRHRG